MKKSESEQKPACSEQPAPWQKTKFANLVRYRPSGTFYLRAKVGGKFHRCSLETDRVTVAKLRLDAKLAELRRAISIQKDIDAGRRFTFAEALRIRREEIAGDANLKPRTLRYYGEVCDAIERRFPTPDRDLRAITDADLKMWAAAFGKDYSANRFNCAVGFMRQMFDAAAERGFLARNPSAVLKRLRVHPKELHLPSTEDFQRLLVEMDEGGGRDSRNCADLARFIAFGGFRISEANAITWGECDFNGGEIIVRGDVATGTKNWTVRRVPMIAEMRALLERLRAEQPEAKPDAPVMAVRECQKALTRACRAVGISRLTHHSLRHLFATRCMESGVDVRTVAEWLGHKDHGVLLLKTYGHVRNAHSREMAKRVVFSPAPPTASANVVQLPAVA